MYTELLNNLSTKIENRLEEMKAIHNFELGNEFEVAICKVLSEFLPTRYAVCKGHIIDQNGVTVGDDIIIYDQTQYPSLRMFAKNDFSQKEHIPFEAVYCYIEAKHTLDLSDAPDASLNKALSQISNTQKLHRKPRPLTKITGKVHINNPFTVTPVGGGFPTIFNPLYTAIISRRSGYAQKKNLNQYETYNLLQKIKWTTPDTPDLIVAGNEVVVLPTYEENLVSFCCSEEHEFIPVQVENSALAVGLCQILWAIKWIELDEMPWAKILWNSFHPSHKKASKERV